MNPPIVPAAAFSHAQQQPISEQRLQEAVQELLTLYGWRWTHFRPARSAKGWTTALSGSPGFFDLVAVRPPRVLFVELKSENGRLRKEQIAWYDDFEAVFLHSKPGEVYVWRPSSWLDGTVERMLR